MQLYTVVDLVEMLLNFDEFYFIISFRKCYNIYTYIIILFALL